MSNTKGTSAIVPPTGGGAQSGMGEKFSPDLFTGTGNFSVPIAVPAGRNGFQPELTLGYSTGNGNGSFGMGWALGIPGVIRKTSRGIPVYKDGEDVFILSGAEDLVPVKQEKETIQLGNTSISWNRMYYRPRTEGLFARIVHHTKTNGEDYWEVHSKDGLVSIYDQTVANPENRKAIFAWHLGKTIDPFGNEIVYGYERELVLSTTPSQPHSFDQLYLSTIQYAQYYDTNVKKYLCEVHFNYEERPDAFSVYRQGFEMRTTRRCKSIETFTHADMERKVKTYHFNYLKELPLNGASMLNSVSVEGHKETESEWMPPLEFGYSTFTPSRRGLRKLEGNIPQFSLAQPGYELVDVTGNGLPDLLQMDGTGARYWTNKGDGQFSSPRKMNVAPSLHLGQPGVQLIDANGDARSDLLINNGVQAGYFSGSFDGVWDEKNYRPYSQIPSFNFADPEVQFMDLNGDGITDVLRNGAKFECFFNDPEKGFDKVRVTDKTFADFSFADPRIRFADMTGDGLQDIVFLSSGKVQYWPNLGYGRFGKPVKMKNAPRFPEQYDPKQILLGDLDGDGQADIAFVDNQSVTLYVNQSGNGFSKGTRVQGTPIVYNLDSLRITDILGTGQAGILWGQTRQMGTSGRMYLFDFTGGNKPYVLEEMNNNMGSITRVAYGSSVYHYLRDEKTPLTRWKTQLPFPVQVVNKVEVLDLLSGGKLATKYNYHNGYWDGAEREFRGFAQVDALDTETFERFNAEGLFNATTSAVQGTSEIDFTGVSSEFYTPPVLTKSWFYPGPIGQDYSRWKEPDFSDQYWQGDHNLLDRTQQTKTLLASLPRSARRDALRTFRGTLLRSEVYAQDGSPLQSRPYTVTESLMGLRLEFEPSQNPDLLKGWKQSGQGYWAGSGYVFFPFSEGQRTTQYERGNDPMHSFSFTDAFDAYGNALNGLSVGLPRGADPLSGGNGNYLGTYSKSEYIYKDLSNGQYMVDRVKRAVSYDATHPANSTTVFAYRDAVFNSNTLPVIGCSLNFYDGEAFEGLPYGQIGKYGVGVRSETLVLTEEIVDKAYGGTPVLLQENPDWTADYPMEFRSMYPHQGGYLYRTANANYPMTGWYAPGDKLKYDFQDVEVTLPNGLVYESKDDFGNLSSIEYDNYQFLPIRAIDPLGLQTQAKYDYRIFQVNKVTDPNDNISVFDFSPLGLLRATAVIGKGTQGDYKSDSGGFYERYEPSVQMEYDFFAFKSECNPVWVKTIQREQYYQQNPNSETIVKVEYSDGFGRLLQTRAQAEDVIFGNQTFGSSGLSPEQSGGNTPAVGIERSENDSLNVVVSGWQIYNNKGKVVEQYEPFFDKGFEYVLPRLSTTGGTIAPQLGVKIKMFYDPIGRVVKTVNPDNSQQWVIYGIPSALNKPKEFTPTPWENYAYDANDLAPLTHPNSNVPQSNWYTPKSSLTDALGRILQTTEHKAHSNADTELYENVVMQYRYDIRGNLLEVRDPYNRKVFEHIYDYRAPQKDENGEKQPLAPLWTKHIDSGISTVFFDTAARIAEATAAKGALTLSTYDNGSRPIRLWAKDKTGESVNLRQVLIYGDDSGLVSPEQHNLKGQLYKHYDDAGLLKNPTFDFKSNLLIEARQVISDSELLSVLGGPSVNCYRVNWTGLDTSILDSKIYETNSAYDALNRVIQLIYPEDIDTQRKILIPTYNRAGALESVQLAGNTYINHIAYNAKGQRLLIAFGNGIMSRYIYDHKTFRLTRNRSESFSQIGWAFSGTGNVKQDLINEYDLAGNIIQTLENVTGCGIGGSNTLERKFSYDPLYRLLKANGRENAPTISPIWDDRYRSTDNSTTTAYTQHYSYDRLGNIQKLQHIGNNNFTRNFNYTNTNNQLQSIEIGMTNYAFAYDECGNQTSETTSRHFEWDVANQLRSFYVFDGTHISQYAQYLYDAGGNRVKKLVWKQNGDYKSTTYVSEIFEYLTDGDAEQNTLSIMDGSSRIASIRLGYDFNDTTPSIKYILDDYLLNSCLLLEANGASINREEYYPFGETSFGSYAKKRYKFSGKEKDEESGLYYFKFRYQSAWTCRFISCDPLSPKYPHNSSYAFAENRVISAIELEGLEALVVSALKFLPDGTPIIQIRPDEKVQDNARSDFRFRVPAGLFGNQEEEIYTTDDLGNPDFGYKEIQKQLGSGKLIKQEGTNDLYFNGIFQSKGSVDSNNAIPNGNYQDVILAIKVPNFDRNNRKNIVTPISFDFSKESDFSKSTSNTQKFTYTAPGSSDGFAQVNLIYDDLGIVNTFTVLDDSGNVMKDDSGKLMTATGKGSFSFSVPSGTNFTIKVTGNTKLGSGDMFLLDGSGTATISAIDKP